MHTVAKDVIVIFLLKFWQNPSSSLISQFLFPANEIQLLFESAETK